MRNIVKIFLICFFSLLVFLPTQASADYADNPIMEGMEIFAASSVFGTKDLRLIATDAINQLIGLLGILSVLVIMYAGVKWMLAGGNDEKVTSAKKAMISGVIGLVIIFTSYSLANFILSALMHAT